MFVCVTLGLSALYFVVTGVQFWITEILAVGYSFTYSEVLICFTITSATAPVLGVVLGGIS